MNPWRDLKKMNREVWLICTSSLINRMGTMVLPFLVLYLTRSMGFPAGKAGLVLAVYGLGSLVSAPLSGKLCDRVGALRVMKGSLVLSGLVFIVYPWIKPYPGILAVSFVLALVGDAFRPASMVILTELVCSADRKVAFALYRLALNLGMSVGPAVGGFLAMVSFPSLFYVDGATCILAALFLVVFIPKLTMKVPEDSEPKGEGAALAALPKTVLSDFRYLYFLLAMFPISLVFFQLHGAYPLFLVKDLHLPEAAFGILFTINTVIIIILEVPLNSAMARWPHRRALSLGTFLVAAGFGAVVFAWNFWTVAATVVIWTFGEMIFLPTAAACSADMAPAARRGEYMGLFTMNFSLCLTLGPWLGTLVYSGLGSDVLWTGAFVLGCLSALMMLRVKVGSGHSC